MKPVPQWIIWLDDGSQKTRACGVSFASRPAPPIPRPGHPMKIHGGFYFVSEVAPFGVGFDRLEIVVRPTFREHFAFLAGLPSQSPPPKRRRFRR